jgi:cytochrome P450
MTFPVPRADPYTPPPEYNRPVGDPPHQVSLTYGGRAWLVTGYEDARAVLASGDFSSDPTLPGYPRFPLASTRRMPGHFLSMDPPEHTRLRRLVTADFTAGGLKPLRPQIEDLTRGLVAALVRRGGPADLIAALATPLPGLVAATLLGVPREDIPLFQAVARDLQVHDATAVRRAAAAARGDRYLRQLIQAKRGTGGQDVLSRLVNDPAAAELGEAEIVGLANLLFVAGLETTGGLIGLTVLALLRNPAAGDLVRANPRRWSGPAVSEALRYWTVVHHGVARVAIRDAIVSAQLIRAGDAVVIHLPTANWDPAVYSAPASYDITRDAHAHLAFGHGAHRCLGSTLAQTVAVTAVTELLSRLPSLRMADPAAEPPFLPHMLIYGLREFTVTW